MVPLTHARCSLREQAMRRSLKCISVAVFCWSSSSSCSCCASPIECDSGIDTYPSWYEEIEAAIDPCALSLVRDAENLFRPGIHAGD